MRKHPLPSLEVVKQLLAYDQHTGLFVWQHSVGGPYGKKLPAGAVAGTLNKEGYRYILIGKARCRATRLAWFYMTGEWPKDQVDHIDRNPSNDAWSNLRAATGSENKANSRPYKKKSCTLKGVQAVQKRHSIRYRAVVSKDGVSKHLGYFDTELEAHMAYAKAAAVVHGEFAYAGVNHG